MNKKKFRKLTDNDRGAIVALYQTGRAARDIAAFMNCDPSTVHKILRDKQITAHYPERAEGARQRHVEKRPAAIFKETPEKSGQITFDDFKTDSADIVPFVLDNETFGDDLGEIIYKAVYNGVKDAMKKG